MNLADAVKELDFSPDTDIANAASKFTDVIKAYIEHIQQEPSLKKVQSQSQALSALYKQFYDYAGAWSIVKRDKYTQNDDYKTAASLKKTAAEAIGDLQKNILRFALIYSHIGRCQALVTKEIEKHESVVGKEKKFQWTSDAGMILQRYQKEIVELKETRKNLEAALVIIKEAEAHLDNYQKLADKVLGKQFEEQLRTIKSKMRVGQFDQAQKALVSTSVSKKKFVLDKKGKQANINAMKEFGKQYIGAIEKAEEYLMSKEGKLYLSSSEVSVAMRTHDIEIEQKRKYIQKYHGPYMEDRRKALLHLKEKLLVLSSLENLMTLYMRLMRGLSEPLVDVKAVRMFEADVVENVTYILRGQFQEISNIEERTEEAINTFFEAVSEFKNMV